MRLNHRGWARGGRRKGEEKRTNETIEGEGGNATGIPSPHAQPAGGGGGGGSEGERGSGGHLGGEKQLKTAATAGDHNPVMGSLRGAGGAGRGRQINQLVNERCSPCTVGGGGAVGGSGPPTHRPPRMTTCTVSHKCPFQMWRVWSPCSLKGSLGSGREPGQGYSWYSWAALRHQQLLSPPGGWTQGCRTMGAPWSGRGCAWVPTRGQNPGGDRE